MLGSFKVVKDCFDANYCESKTENFAGTVIKTHCCYDNLCNSATSLKMNILLTLPFYLNLFF